mgnify:CR=1 FL=1
MTGEGRQEDAMGKLWRKMKNLIPEYGVMPLLIAVALNFSVYGGARVIAGDWIHHNIQGKLDGMIPFLPFTAAIYLGCYLFWIVNYILIARRGKREVCQFFAADFISRLICFACYLIYPTTNVRPVVEPEGFWNQVMILLYTIDAADNLFPSIHCLVSWFCFAGLRGERRIPRWYKAASCVMALLVCISTLTTKQHVIVDVVGGVALAELCLWIGKRPKVWKTYEKLLDEIDGKLLLEGGSA